MSKLGNYCDEQVRIVSVRYLYGEPDKNSETLKYNGESSRMVSHFDN